MLYYDQFPLRTVEEQVLGARFTSREQLVEQSDVITINTPLTPETDGMFDRNLIFSMKKGAYLVNTARGKIVDTAALVEALEVGQLAGYAGDVWYPIMQWYLTIPELHWKRKRDTQTELGIASHVFSKIAPLSSSTLL
jgi:lactate dehydrogenase-like 2-hydroxyacid dehydrogenase